MEMLSRKQFGLVASLAKEYWGLNLTEKKMDLVCNRLGKFLMKSPYSTVEEYLDHLTNEADDEDRLVFFDLLSTNVTSFFRERHHFDYLERELYTPLSRGTLTLPGKRLRIWSAGCSTGCEPYTMAIHASENLENIGSWDVKILATDLSNTAVETAQKGVYRRSILDGIDDALLSKYFLKGTGPNADKARVNDTIRSMVSVARLNLMDRWPVKGPFDVIFCRNVMIYFDRPTRERLINRFCDLLRPGGILAIGSSETLSGIEAPVRPVAPTTYVK